MTLAATISLAGIFGAALLWAVIYYLHRYMHRECCKAKAIFTTFVGNIAQVEDHEAERAEEDLRRGRSDTLGREREREREKDRGRKKRDTEEAAHGNDIYDTSRSGMRETDHENEREETMEKRIKRDVEGKDRSDEKSQGSSCVSKKYTQRQEHYSFEEDKDDGGIVLQPYMPVLLPAFVPLAQPQVPQYMTLNIPPSDPALRVGQGEWAADEGIADEWPHPLSLEEEPYTTLNEEQGTGELEEPELYSAASRDPQRLDFIEVCDEYPPIIRDTVEKGTRDRTESDDSSLSSSSIDEEVPRGPIPTATQRPAFEFPRTPWRMDPTQIPTSYPRQW